MASTLHSNFIADDTYQSFTSSERLIFYAQEQEVNYSKTRKIYLEYKRLPKAKKAEFYELHRAEIELQEAARAAFDQLPEGTKLPTVNELNAERTRLIQERQAEYAEYRKVKAERTEFIRVKKNADVILYSQEAVRDEQQIE